jgi:hypothetical protein
MRSQPAPHIASVIGKIPYRIALAGGWIDQPFVSRHNPAPPGSMVVFGIEPTFRCMDRSGMATSTREVARKLWGDELPDQDPRELVRTLYNTENAGKPEPSGSQDMAGLIIPGISRLDYDIAHEGGYFPAHIENCNDAAVARWLEQVLHLLPITPRPDHYSPLDVKNLDREWIRRLGQSGKDCFAAIQARDLSSLGQSMNECMKCWEAILPGTVRHPALRVDLGGILNYYQSRYAGAMYSGCGGGYLFVGSDEPVAGALRVKVRLKEEQSKLRH